MAQQVIITTPVNSGSGTPLDVAFNYCNNNFGELYARAQTSPPATLVGSPGDVAGMYAYDDTYWYYCFANYDGSSTIWGQLAQIGNITVNNITNGTSNVSIPTSGGNVNFTVGSVANIGKFTNTGLVVAGNISATGTYSGANITANNISSVTVSASGNVTGAYIIGDGSQLTGVVSSYGNANVAAYLPVYTGNIYPGAIITDGYYYANGTPFTGSGGGSYGNTQVAAYLPTYTGNLGGNLTQGVQTGITQLGTLTELTVSGIHDIDFHAVASNIALYTSFGGAITITPSSPGSMDNMVIGANTPASGKFTSVSATGNVTATYFIGDGSQLTGITGGTGNYSNANVAAYLPTYTGNLAGGNANITTNVTVGSTVTTNHITGQLTGTVNGINTSYGIWDFGSITGTDFYSPIAWIFSQTSAGNVDMGTISSPSANNIDIGTIY